MIGRIATLATAVGVFASAAVFPFAAKAQDNDDSVLQPSSPWNLRYDEDKCRLVREFGGEQRHLLLIDQSGPEPFYTLTVLGDRTDRFYRGMARVQFGPNEEPTNRSFIRGKDDGTPLVVMHGVTLAPVLEKPEGEAEPIGSVREAAIDRVIIGTNSRVVVDLRTGPMGEPLAALRKCTEDLEAYLTLDTTQGGEDPKPKDIERWLTSADYPARMIDRNEEGVVSFRLTVGLDGRPSSCHIQNSTRPQTFDDVVCLALLKRAQFEPAKDADGQPRSAYYSGTVRFQMP